ncbi:MAG: hypothetical protein KBD78_12245 [Oligoflexales bacterium]|nr:hypothetical protein [Oligoflexales bacterium]
MLTFARIFTLFFVTSLFYPASAFAVKSILELQPFKKTGTASLGEGTNLRTYNLVNLNSNINKWFLLQEFLRKGASTNTIYHLENIDPQNSLNIISENDNVYLEISKTNSKENCSILSEEIKQLVRESIKSKDSYTPVCNNLLYIRNFTPGRQSAKEQVTGFLREHIWGGEKITNIVKTSIYQDEHLITAETKKAKNNNVKQIHNKTNLNMPKSAEIDSSATAANSTLVPKSLGVSLKGDLKANGLQAGEWYPTLHNPNIFVSVISPKLISKDIMQSYPTFVGNLDKVEQDSLVYLISINLEQNNLEYMIGTEHPSVEWSSRALPSVMDKKIPGPDGIASIEPLISTGRINPGLTRKTTMSFIGGFKRNHSAFRWGKLAETNQGSHYGVIENGVIYSRLNPELATLIIDKAGKVDLLTWKSEFDSTLLPEIKHARQNGVSIIEKLDANGKSVPGSLVKYWGAGNWSGSVDSKQRALRAALCIQEHNGKKHLIYGYFSSSTPNTLARVFQAYNCSYAFHLDMNALEHTYLAIYHWVEKQFHVEHLIQGMEVLDSKFNNRVLPRFLGMSDNRDFFYLISK